MPIIISRKSLEDESRYKVVFNKPKEGQVTLPNGTVLALDYWLSLAADKKLSLVGGVSYTDKTVTLPTGETKTLEWWNTLSPEEQSSYTTTPWEQSGMTKEEYLRKTSPTYGTDIAAETNRAQLDESRRQFDIAQAWREKQEALANAQQNAMTQAELQTSLENRRAAQIYSMLNTPEQAQAAAAASMRPQLERTFEQWRERLLGEIQAEPRQWVNEWQLKNKANPYTPAPESAGETLQALRDEYKRVSEAKKIVETRFNDVNDPLVRDKVLTNPQTTEEQLAKATLDRFNAVRDRLVELNVLGGKAPAELMAQPSGYYPSDMGERLRSAQPVPTGIGGNMVITGEGGNEPARPTRPEIPADVMPFLEKPEFGAPVVTPSGQQWAKTPWSSRERVWGYAESLGQNPSDILDKMAMSQTNTPNRAVYWRPPEQRR